jgi:hypothetical protein
MVQIRTPSLSTKCSDIVCLSREPQVSRLTTKLTGKLLDSLSPCTGMARSRPVQRLVQA